MNSTELTITISVIDKVSEPIKGIAALFEAPLAKAIHNAGQAAAGFGQQFVRTFGPGGAIGGAVAGLNAIVKSFADTGSEIRKLSAMTGTSAERFQELAYAANMAGAPQKALADGLSSLNGALADAANGGKAAKVFDEIGVSVKDADGRIRSATDVIGQIADALAANESAAVRTRIATELLGKTGAGLIPMLAGGSGALAAQAEEARRLGLVLSDEAVGSAHDLGTAYEKLGKTISSFGLAIGAQLAPVLIPLIAQFTEWLSKNRELIGQGVERVVLALADGLRTIDFGALLNGLEHGIKLTVAFIDFIGGWGIALLGLSVAFGPLILAIVQVGIAFAELGSTLGPVFKGPVLQALTHIGSALAGLGAVLETTFKGPVLQALGHAGAAVVRLGSVLLANPIALAVAAIAAAALLIYANWDRIGPWFSELWANVRGIFGDFAAFLSGAFTGDVGGMVDELMSLWDGFASYIGGLWKRIVGVFSWAWSFIEPVVAKVLGGMDVLNTVKDAVKAGWNGVTGLFQGEGQKGPVGTSASSPVLAAAGPAQVNGRMVVHFDNAPHGMRVAPGTTDQSGMHLDPSVGYRATYLEAR